MTDFSNISIPITLVKKLFEAPYVFEVQYFGIVKGGDDTIKKIHLSFNLYNNGAYKIIRKINLLLNDEVRMAPNKIFQFQGLAGAAPDKPFLSFIWGEKSTKELNIEFQTEDGREIVLEENNNIKILLTDDEGLYIVFEFGVLLDRHTIQKIKSHHSNGKPVVFNCYHFKIEEYKDPNSK